MGRVLAAYGGGFKPPTRGHFEIVQKALNEFPEIDEFFIYVGGKERDGIDQAEAIQVWEIYKKYLANKVDIQPAKQPIKSVLDLAKENPQDIVYFILGYREGREDDTQDITDRSKLEEKYPNLIVKTLGTPDPNMSGTNARKAIADEEEFIKFLPDEVEEKSEIWNIIRPAVNENDPKKGTGKKPEGSKRRLYTDEDPKDTVGIKFSTRQDIVDTLGKASFKAKSHARQSQIINLIHQRVRAAYGRAKDPAVKKRLKTGLDYITDKKEASKKKTQRLKKQKLKENKLSLDDTILLSKTLRDKDKMKEIHSLLVQMFPKQKEFLDYNYKNDQFNDFRPFIFYIDEYIFEGPKLIPYTELKLDPDAYAEREKKYKEYVEGKIDKYFNSSNSDPRKVDLSKVPPITIDAEGMVAGGNHRAFLAIKQQKPLKAYQVVKANNTHPNVEKILNIIGRKNQKENIDPKSQKQHKGKAAPFGSAYEPVKEGDTYEKMAAKGKKSGNLKQGTVRKRLGIAKDKKIPLSKINKEISRLKKMDKDKDKKGVQLGDKNQKYYKALQLSKTLKTTTNINENATYSKKIDLINNLASLTQHMLDKGMNISPLPKLEFINGDVENASQFLGKTAYYDPNTQTIVLYTEGRHPKDITRSYAHEMIHHMQNLEGRLGNIQTTNTLEDDNLNNIEAEANLKGTMTFRNWTDSLNENLNENLNKNPNHLYHWTSYSSLKKIIESNKLKSNKSNRFFEYDTSRDLPDYKNVVFFTIENERFADEETSNQCILVVDKSKLSKDYKVISYDDPYEETVVYTNDPSIPILPYLKGVLLMNTLQKSAVKKIVSFLESKGIPYEINDNLEREVKAKQAKLPSLKKELINKLKLKYPNGFIGYLNTPLVSRQTPEYFKDNSTYSYPNVTINKPGEYGEKNKFQVKFKIEPQNLEKYINWFMYSPDSIEDLINMDNYEGEELWLKGDIPLDINSLNEAIVGDKIECDSCGWSWKIIDGGNDLFMCHKCGHDNTPINEDKSYKHKFGFNDKLGKDPFGLNQFAREIATEVEDIMNKEKTSYKIFSDMDGVLTDFDKSFLKYSEGIPPREYEKTYGKEKFWELIDGKGKVGFWVGMPWMEDGKQYWDYIKNYDTELLSSPSRSSTSRLGKRLWVRNNMPGIKLTLAQAAKKQNYAAPNHILIDDRPSNIDQWRSQGGIGILHTSAADTISQLKKLGL